MALLSNVINIRRRDPQLLSLVNSAWDTGRKCRLAVERDWHLTRAYLMGYQYILWDSTTQRLVKRRPGAPAKIALTDNIMLPRYRRQVAKLVKNRPKWQVIPNTLESEDIKAAKLGVKVLEHLDRQLSMQAKRRELAEWIFTTGTGYLFDTWAAQSGQVGIRNRDGTYTQRMEGEVSVEVDSPFSWYWPAVPYGPTKVDDMPWGLRVTLRPLNWFHANFERGHLVKAEKIPVGAEMYNYATPPEQTTPASHTKNVPAALCKELFRKPDATYPEGLYKITAGSVVLMETTFPTYAGNYEYPVTHFKDISVPGIFWGWPTSYHAIFLQKDWNAVRSSISSYVRGMAKVKWAVPKTAGLSKVAFNDQHMEVLEYNPVRGKAPEQVRIAPLPQSVFANLELITTSIMNLYSQHESSEGRVPLQVRSSWAINALREADDEPLGTVHESFEEGFSRVGRHALVHVVQNYADERTVKIVGRGQAVQIHKLKGADLRNNTDVRIVTGSSLPDSKVGKQSAVIERYEKGLYGPVADPETGLRVRRLLDDLIEEDIYGDRLFDETNAENEDEQIAQLAKEIAVNPDLAQQLIETVPTVKPYDNHVIHLQVHERELKRPEQQAYYETPIGQLEMSMKLLHAQQHTAMYLQGMIGGPAGEAVSSAGRSGESMPANPPNVPPGRMERQGV